MKMSSLKSCVLSVAIGSSLIICAFALTAIAQEQTPAATVQAAADEAKKIANGDNQKFNEIFTAKVGEKLDDRLLKKRHDAILSPVKSKSSIYQNPRFRDLYPILITDSLKERRIWGGKLTGLGEFNACVAVGDDAEYCCSGTLIGKRIVCTAGHCSATNPGESDPTRVFIGSSIDSPGHEYRVHHPNGVFRHKDYHADQSPHNDLTLLILEKDVDAAQPVPIAKTNVAEAMETVQVVGFGNTNKGGTSGYGTKRKADVIVISPDGIRFGGQKYGADTGLEFVAEDLHADTCTGDSGGPAFLSDHGQWFLVGATSRATKKGVEENVPCGDGGIYVRVDKYVDWIREIAHDNGVAFP
jgi:secreted trypsin-like serine protease